MTPERMTPIGSKIIWDDELGIPEIEVSPLEHLVGNMGRVRAFGKEGTLVGWIDPIVGSPRYELVLIDGETSPSGIHMSKIEFI